jgi:phosphoserine phosphatase RsbU/P
MRATILNFYPTPDLATARTLPRSYPIICLCASFPFPPEHVMNKGPFLRRSLAFGVPYELITFVFLATHDTKNAEHNGYPLCAPSLTSFAQLGTLQCITGKRNHMHGLKLEETAIEGSENLTFLDLAERNPLLGQLSKHSLECLLARSQLVEVDADQHLLRQGTPSDAAYLLVAGEVDVLAENAYGSVQLARLSAGTLVGEVGVFTELPRNASVIARGSIRALRFAREDLLAAGTESPHFVRSIMSKLGQYISNYNHALGFFTNALTALEQRNFDLRLLDDLMYPMPELISFSQTFRRIAEQIMLRQAHNREMDSAAAIQRAFLPDALLMDGHASNLQIFADMRPAKEVGGDLYDFFFVEANKLAITIGDVCGKGVPASLFMAVTQSVIRLALRQGGVLAEKIKAANDLLSSDNKETMFVTLFCAVLDLTTGVLTYCNCGHNPPLVLRKNQDAVERLQLTGVPLGIDCHINYSTHEVSLAPDDCLVLFTDGITEAMNIQGEQYGDERLEQAVRVWRNLHPREFVNHIIDAASAFAGDAPQSDDMTCLSLVYRALS